MLSTIVRAAVWNVHRQRCAYTGDPIPFGSLEIDHIIPISIAESDFHRLCERGIIPPNFDLNGLENLLPTSRRYNLQKSDTIRSDNFYLAFLAVASEAKPKIEKVLHQEYASERTLQGYLLLKAQAEKNDLQIDEVIDIKRQEVEGQTRVRLPPELVDCEDLTLLNAKAAEELMDKTLAIGGGVIHEVVLRDRHGNITACKTCREFLAAKDSGLWALTQFDMNCFSMADRTCEMLRLLKTAAYAPASQIRFPRIDMKDLDRWSSDWISFTENTDENASIRAQHKTIGSLLHAGICSIISLSSAVFDVDSDRGFPSRVAELFRADLDGDGEEEIAVSHLTYAPEGTFRSGLVRLAKPSNTDGIIYPVDLPYQADYDPGRLYFDQ